ncbi:MAG: hypothetical protein M3167_13230 [Acidobacteriota bacterium]|nr:hypothetical protein [Acidobacteriota bacterium]
MSRKTVATYEDARLILHLYELRREPRLREARDWFTGKFQPKSVDDVRTIGAARGSPENVSYRMVTTYWDMAASFVARGILDSELFLESGGEMLVVWARLEPFVADLRQGNARLLKNVEQVIEESPSAQERVGELRKRFAKA